MADPRQDVRFDGIKPVRVTIAHDDTIVYDKTKVGGAAQVGLAVTLESNKTVSLVGDGENVFGQLISVEGDGLCVVQIAGMVKLPGGASATLTAGTKIVGDLGAGNAEGYVQTVTTQHTVSRGVIIDSSDATAVDVWL